jgi:hypothetical protein
MGCLLLLRRLGYLVLPWRFCEIFGVAVEIVWDV